MKYFSFLLAALASVLCAMSQGDGDHFLSQPSLTPDGLTVIFSFEGDLWKANVKTGQAERLTAMPGYETGAKVSPDGNWIAFTGRQSGNADLFVMPVNGGDIKQLTWHSANDELSSWSWDSKKIYFTSNRSGQQSGYTVSKDGGTPQRVFGNYYFLFDHNLCEHPSSGEIFFNDTWESSNQVQRKRYHGPFNADIESYNIHTKQYKRYTDYNGKDFGATIDKNGNIYFISDEANGEYNLYTFDHGKKTALTDFTSSIKTPFVNANGGKIVFEKDYQLFLYDVASKKSEKLAISIRRNAVLDKQKDFDIKNNISDFDISPDGKKMAFSSRGELFVSDVEGKFIRQLSAGAAERIREVKWLSDNKTLIFSQTFEGYPNWYTIGADGSAPLKQVTKDHRSNRAISLNKSRTKAVYLSGRDELRVLDLKTMADKTIVKDEIWALQSSSPFFSPDDRWIVFTAHRNFEEDIFVYNIASGATTNLTHTGVSESDPMWTADGKYMLFSSNRLAPSYPFGSQNSRLYRMPLEKSDASFSSDRYDDLFRKDTSRKDSTVHIDSSRMMERLEQVGPTFGTQGLLTVLAKGDKTIILFVSNHDQGRMALWKLTLDPFEAPKTEKIAGADAGNISFAASGDKYFVLFNGGISKLNLEANKVDPVNMSFTFRRNLSGEFSQLFDEAWALMEENYYDDHFHGLDWVKTKEKYRRYLPFVNNRADLRVLMNDMLGELNSSHQGFFTSGDDEEVPLKSVTMETGIVFAEENPYEVKYVLRRSPADKKDIAIQPGDLLVKVNDQVVDKNTDRSYYFTRPSVDKEMELSFTRNGKEYKTKLHPGRALGPLLYDEWIDNNQQRVDERSKGRIAYGYMKNMGRDELEKFIIDMTQELNGKDALIFDLRYNTGGNVHDEVLKFLSQHSYLQWKYREGQLTRQGNFTPGDKPIILLTNEQSLSDAEMTSQGFKALKLGKIVGNDTYHWIIFTTNRPLVDGSIIRLPSWGCYTLAGEDIETHGVQPDIQVVNNFTDKIGGKDPQLDRAIDEILSQLKK